MFSPRSRVAIQRNPISGSGRRDHELKALIAGLKSAGLKPYLFSQRERFAARLESPEFRAELRCLVAAGGDGTVDDLINRYPGLPLAIFAMGTENLLAKHCRVPASGAAVAQMIAAGFTRTIDLGQAGQHRFAVMASCGFDAEVVQRAHARRRGRITKMHYIPPIAATLCRTHLHELHVTFDQQPDVSRAQLAIISNIDRYALRLPVNPAADDIDGRLHVCLVERAGPVRLVGRFLQGMLTGQITGPGIERRVCRQLRITSPTPVAVQADGDPIGTTPLEFRVLPQALELIVPEAVATGQLESAANLTSLA